MNYLCPICDREVPVGSQCSHCAKKSRRAPRETKSWEQEEHADGLDLPDEDFDYDDFVAREFGKAPHRKTGIAWYWYLVAVLLLIAMLLGIFR
jgi:hypothetical protein